MGISKARYNTKNSRNDAVYKLFKIIKTFSASVCSYAAVTGTGIRGFRRFFSNRTDSLNFQLAEERRYIKK